jgi:truncated hemoglobin YjbI
MFAAIQKTVSPRKSLGSKSRLSEAGKGASQSQGAPHPVPAGREHARCPITGLGLGDEQVSIVSNWVMKATMDSDADIVEERRALEGVPARVLATLPALRASANPQFVRLSVVNRAHRATSATKQSVQEIGSVQTLQAFTENFYEKAFQDSHVDRFIANHDEPHGFRFALWIAEKLGDGMPWTEERLTRPIRTMRLGHEVREVAFDRSSAHFAAWHSPKREPEKWGDHFKLDDARVWMRLHFWAARETGVFEHPEFMDYYVRFIGHFINVYSSKSPAFARESARWSADPSNIKRYLDSGRLMNDIIGKPYELAIEELPENERLHTGSGHPRLSWPYDEPSMNAWQRCTTFH